jgi:hypothetical protein
MHDSPGLGRLYGREYYGVENGALGYRSGVAPFKLAVDKDFPISMSAKLITPNNKHLIHTHARGLPSI